MLARPVQGSRVQGIRRPGNTPDIGLSETGDATFQESRIEPDVLLRLTVIEVHYSLSQDRMMRYV
jgi:hypothetical protein